MSLTVFDTPTLVLNSVYNTNMLYHFRVTELSISEVGNTSEIKVQVFIRKLVDDGVPLTRLNVGRHIYHTTSGVYPIQINGENNNIYVPITTADTLVWDVNYSVTHNTTGQSTLTLQTYLIVDWIASTLEQYSIPLSTIDRTSKIATFNDFAIGDPIPVVITRTDVALKNILTLYIGSTLIASRTMSGDSTTITLSAAENDILYANMSSVVTSSVTLVCTTREYTTTGNLVGSPSSKTSTATIKSSIVPSIGSFTCSGQSGITGTFVQNISSANFNTSATAQPHTTLSYSITFLGSTYYASSASSSVIPSSGTLTAVATVTDSRGRTATSSIGVVVQPYSTPNITEFSLSRRNAYNVVDAMGTYVRVGIGGSVSSLINVVQKNSLTYTLYSKPRTSSTWVVVATSTVSGVSVGYTATLSTYLATSSYDFKLEIQDKFRVTTSLQVLSTGQVTLSLGVTGIGVGKVWEQGALDILGDVLVDGTIKLSGNTGYTIGQARNITLSPLDANVSQMVEGSIWIKYI